jgi:hypothetical protein
MIAIVQGSYYLLTGLWPVLHMPSFESVSGPKKDYWLVQSYGILLGTIGSVLIISKSDIKLLGIAIALAIAIPNIIFSLKNVISKIYLADAIVQLGFVSMWLIF